MVIRTQDNTRTPKVWLVTRYPCLPVSWPIWPPLLSNPHVSRKLLNIPSGVRQLTLRWMPCLSIKFGLLHQPPYHESG